MSSKGTGDYNGTSGIERVPENLAQLAVEFRTSAEAGCCGGRKAAGSSEFSSGFWRPARVRVRWCSLRRPARRPCSLIGGDTYIPAAAFDTTIVNSDSDTTRVAFDRGTARMTLSAVGRVWAGARVLESFDVSGVPAGTPVPVTIIFALDCDVLNRCGGGGCGAYFTARLATNADSVIADASIPGPCDSCTRRLSTTLTLPVTITAGTPLEVAFAMLYHTSNVAWGRVYATGVYGVSGLPNGARAVACSGADLTPVRRTTWGRLKSTYR